MKPSVRLAQTLRNRYFWWELVNASSKLVLVGFLVLERFQPGSLVQLVMGTMVAFGFAIVQVQYQPYLDRFTNILATVTSVSQSVFFLSATLFRFHSLTNDFEAVAKQLESK